MTVSTSAQQSLPPLMIDELPRFLRRPPVALGKPEERSQQAEPRRLTPARLIACVILPFAAGYFLSYVFRSINAVLASSLVDTFDLSPATLGLMTSMYFLACVGLQLPLGAAIDRWGPRRVQSALMLAAALGAAIFAAAHSLSTLILGRALIGIGVAVALMTGLKAIVLWVPPERAALANGGLVMLGALGAVAATLPAETLIDSYGWRWLFGILAVLCAAVAALIVLIVPETTRYGAVDRQIFRISHVYRDHRFWRLAPLSTAIIATSWSLQGLWAAPWLSEVEGLAQRDIVDHLFAMAIALSAGALAIGIGADRVRRHGISTSAALAAIAALSIVAQLAVILRLPAPTLLPWMTIAAAGAGTVLSFASMTDLFPKECSGRANAALDLLHVAGAFLVQCAIGLVVSLWSEEDGRHPVEAYQTAFAAILGLQVAALAWFVVGQRRSAPTYSAHPLHRSRSPRNRHGPGASIYDIVVNDWIRRVHAAREQARCWRLAAIGSFALTLTLTAGLFDAIVRRDEGLVHIVQNGAASESVAEIRREYPNPRVWRASYPEAPQ